MIKSLAIIKKIVLYIKNNYKMKNVIKKILFSLWVIWLVWTGSLGLVNAQNTFWNPAGGNENVRSWSGDTEHWLNVAAKDTDYRTNKLVPTIKKFINRVLWMLSLIALVICLRGWFQMLTAAGDEGKYKKWFTILKQAAIALAVIWLSWLFVTLILYLINNATS